MTFQTVEERKEKKKKWLWNIKNAWANTVHI